LVLFVYAFTHFLVIGLGLVSSDVMHLAQEARALVTRSWPGTLLIYGALLGHFGLALVKLSGLRTLRMPWGMAIQNILGLAIPLLLVAHLVYTRGAHELYGVEDDMGFIAVLLWGSPDAIKQSALLIVVWVHGCIGLHFWLRGTQWWRAATPYLIGLGVLIPAAALAGFMTEGRRARTAFGDPTLREQMMAEYNWPTPETFQALLRINSTAFYVVAGIIALAGLVYLGRKFLSGRNSVRIRYVGGPEVTAAKGQTLLEISRTNGIPHTALCGGRGRCTTCRVIVEEGADLLHAPSDAERRSLEAVNAPPGARLACQIRPTDPATVFRVFRPDGRMGRAHASQGRERRLAILFLDMRGFTARTTGQLPYDVVFLLNRFFDAIVPSITGAGGTIDKYLGDGLLAVFDTQDEESSAKAALQAAAGVRSALVTFNRTLVAEGAPEVRVGIGLHLGDLVLGEIGAAGNAPRTIIGDTVNTASRLEGATKDLGLELLVSEALLKSAGIDTAPLDLITLELRGVSEPLQALGLTAGVNLDLTLDRATKAHAPSP
jgi:adenylate cyclase